MGDIGAIVGWALEKEYIKLTSSKYRNPLESTERPHLSLCGSFYEKSPTCHQETVNTQFDDLLPNECKFKFLRGTKLPEMTVVVVTILDVCIVG